jgi:hypothetical protein
MLLSPLALFPLQRWPRGKLQQEPFPSSLSPISRADSLAMLTFRRSSLYLLFLLGVSHRLLSVLWFGVIGLL